MIESQLHIGNVFINYRIISFGFGLVLTLHIAQAIAISEVRGELILRLRVGGLTGRSSSSSRPTVRKVCV